MDPFTREVLVAVYGNDLKVNVTNEFDIPVYYKKVIETGHFTVSNCIFIACQF